jgi:hypothetical protein
MIVPALRLNWHEVAHERLDNRAAGLCGLGYANVRVGHDGVVWLHIAGQGRQRREPFTSVADAQLYAERVILRDARRLVSLIEGGGELALETGAEGRKIGGRWSGREPLDIALANPSLTGRSDGCA